MSDDNVKRFPNREDGHSSTRRARSAGKRDSDADPQNPNGIEISDVEHRAGGGSPHIRTEIFFRSVRRVSPPVAMHFAKALNGQKGPP